MGTALFGTGFFRSAVGGWTPRNLFSKLKLELYSDDSNLLVLDGSNNVIGRLDNSNNTQGSELFTNFTNIHSNTVDTFSQVAGSGFDAVESSGDVGLVNNTVVDMEFVGQLFRVRFDLTINSITGTLKFGILQGTGTSNFRSSLLTYTSPGVYSVDAYVYCTVADSSSYPAFGVTGADVCGWEVRSFSLKKQAGNYFYQGAAAPQPPWDTVSKITYDALAEFHNGSDNLASYTALGSGMISWVAQVNSENRLGVFTLGNSADDTELLQIGIDLNNKIYYRCQTGALDDVFISTNTVADGDICQVRSVGSAIEIYKNGILETIIISSGTNDTGNWLDAPTVDNVSIGAIVKTSTIYYPEESQALLLTTGETSHDILNIFNYLNERF